MIFYDQIGCGLSGIPESRPELWTVKTFTDEIDTVRAALGLERIHLLGQSWGGMLAMEYMLTQPDGRRQRDHRQLAREHDPVGGGGEPPAGAAAADVQATLLRHEAAGTTDSAEYAEAEMVFYHRHVCIPDPFPEYVTRSFDKLAANPEVYHTMNGPSEFHVIGTLKDWDIIPRLGEIRAPTLVTSGRHDEATPLIASTVQQGIPGAEWVVFERSSHMAHAEEPERVRGGARRVPVEDRGRRHVRRVGALRGRLRTTVDGRGGARRAGRPGTPVAGPGGDALLTVRGLRKRFPLPQSMTDRMRKVPRPGVTALDGVDLDVPARHDRGGRGRERQRQVHAGARDPAADRAGRGVGRVRRHGRGRRRDAGAMRTLRKRMQIVFQDPYSSLNPRMTVGAILSEVLSFHGVGARRRRSGGSASRTC